MSFQFDDSTFDETVTLYDSELNCVLSIKYKNRISTERIPSELNIQSSIIFFVNSIFCLFLNQCYDSKRDSMVSYFKFLREKLSFSVIGVENIIGFFEF